MIFKIIEEFGQSKLLEPYGIFRISEILDKVIIAEVGGLDDPNISDFLIVWQYLNNNNWVIEFKEKTYLASRVDASFKEQSTLDTGYFYCPYLPLR